MAKLPGRAPWGLIKLHRHSSSLLEMIRGLGEAPSSLLDASDPALVGSFGGPLLAQSSGSRQGAVIQTKFRSKWLVWNEVLAALRTQPIGPLQPSCPSSSFFLARSCSFSIRKRDGAGRPRSQSRLACGDEAEARSQEEKSP